MIKVHVFDSGQAPYTAKWMCPKYYTFAGLSVSSHYLLHVVLSVQQ